MSRSSRALRDQGRAESRFAQEGVFLVQSGVAAESVRGLPYAIGTKALLAAMISRRGGFGVGVVATAVDTRDSDGLHALANAGFKSTGVLT